MYHHKEILTITDQGPEFASSLELPGKIKLYQYTLGVSLHIT